jgi:hypothetical protein
MREESAPAKHHEERRSPYLVMHYASYFPLLHHHKYSRDLTHRVEERESSVENMCAATGLKMMLKIAPNCFSENPKMSPVPGEEVG